MSIPGLTIIGESINDSVPSTHALFEENNIDGIVISPDRRLRKARHILMSRWLPLTGAYGGNCREDPGANSAPLSIDTPDPAIAAAGLEAYSAERAGHIKPILNSISEARLEMFDLYAKQPFVPVLLVTEG